jgi:hypothetical protein
MIVSYHPFGKGRIPTGKGTLSKTRNNIREMPAASAAVASEVTHLCLSTQRNWITRKPNVARRYPKPVRVAT